MFLGASAHCTDVGELAFWQLALTGLVAATNGLAFVHADPVGRKIRDLTLAFAAAFLWQALDGAVRPGRGGRDLRGLALGVAFAYLSRVEHLALRAFLRGGQPLLAMAWLH